MNPVAKLVQIAFVVLVGASGALRADTLTLRDGTQYEGELLRETKDSLVFNVRWCGMNGAVTVPKSEVVSIQVKPLSPDRVIAGAKALIKEAEEASIEIARVPSTKLQTGVAQVPAEDAPVCNPQSAIRNRTAADAWVNLGEYYQRHVGYSAQAREAYEKALLYDNDHPVARWKLGYIKGETGWIEIPKQVVKAEDVTIGVRRELPRPEGKIENPAGMDNQFPNDRRLVSVPAEPPVPPYGGYGYGYGWGGTDLIITTWPGYRYGFGYGYGSYQPCYRGYYPYSFGILGRNQRWPSYSYAPIVPRSGFGGSWGHGGWHGGGRGHH